MKTNAEIRVESIQYLLNVIGGSNKYLLAVEHLGDSINQGVDLVAYDVGDFIEKPQNATEFYNMVGALGGTEEDYEVERVTLVQLEEPDNRTRYSLVEIVGFDKAMDIQAYIFEGEYTSTLEGEWAESEEDKLSKWFLRATSAEKKAFSWKHANEYVAELSLDTQEVINAYGNDYFQDISSLDIDLEAELKEYESKQKEAKHQFEVNKQITLITQVRNSLRVREKELAETVRRTQEEGEELARIAEQAQDLTIAINNLGLLLK